MFIIRYRLATGETRQSQFMDSEETADRWRRLLRQDPQVVEAVVLPAEEAIAAAVA